MREMGFGNFQEKLLHEVVFPGSHDAGITTGGGNVRTQSLNVGEQASAGCRLFDIRVVAQKTGKVIEHKAYHAAKVSDKKPTRTSRWAMSACG